MKSGYWWFMLQWMCAKGIYDVHKSAHIEYSIKSKGEKYDVKIEYWTLFRIFSFGQLPPLIFNSTEHISNRDFLTFQR